MSKRNSQKDNGPENNQPNENQQWVYLTTKEVQQRQMYINEMIKNAKKALGIQVRYTPMTA